MQWLDDFFERKTRQVAQRTSRRDAIARLGKGLLGATLLFPVLPAFSRTLSGNIFGGSANDSIRGLTGNPSSASQPRVSPWVVSAGPPSQTPVW
mgnify:CR=1 FL=1